MAQFTKVHGDYQPVMNYDAANYAVGAINAFTSAATVQPAGPKLVFVTATSTVGHFTTTQVNAIIQTIQQLATVYTYEITTGATYDSVAVAMYPVGAWDIANGSAEPNSLDVAITAVAGAVTMAESATFTN